MATARRRELDDDSVVSTAPKVSQTVGLPAHSRVKRCDLRHVNAQRVGLHVQVGSAHLLPQGTPARKPIFELLEPLGDLLGAGRAPCNHDPHSKSASAALSVQIDRANLGRLLAFRTSLDEELEAGKVRLQGDAAVLQRLLDAIDKLDKGFALIEP